jgi:quercetin dioxygenase-like cupin family protein
MPTPINLQRWTEIAREPLNDLITRQMLHGERMTIARLELRKGATVPMHSHANEQISMIAAGVLQFDVDGTQAVVQAGEMLHLPGGVPHSVLALEDSVAIDVFSPVREDWIRGDDAYLRGR